jgi:hypothetical protein
LKQGKQASCPRAAHTPLAHHLLDEADPVGR